MILGGPLEAARILVRLEAAYAAVARPAGGAGVQGEVATDGTKVSQRLLGRRRRSTLVVRPLLVLLEQLLEVLAILGTKVLGALALDLLLLAVLQAFLKLGQLLGHDQVGMGVVVKVILLQSLQSLAGASLPGGHIQHTLLFCILDAIGLPACHCCISLFSFCVVF